MNLPDKIITYLYRTNTPKNIVVELHDEAAELRAENKRLEYESEQLAKSLSSAIQTAKDWQEIAEKRSTENDQLRALLAKIHDEAAQAPGGYLISGEVMREIAEVV